MEVKNLTACAAEKNDLETKEQQHREGYIRMSVLQDEFVLGEEDCEFDSLEEK